MYAVFAVFFGYPRFRAVFVFRDKDTVGDVASLRASKRFSIPQFNYIIFNAYDIKLAGIGLNVVRLTVIITWVGQLEWAHAFYFPQGNEVAGF
jgi:hypothetical protein